MYKTQLLDYLPLWGGYLAMVAVFLVAAEGGYRLAGYRLHRKDVGQTSQAGAIMGATLGLLAFMLAFTFGMGASRFDTRKQLVLDEANAVRTAYLRADLLPQSARAEFRDLLREYVAVRVRAVGKGEDELRQGIARSEELHGLLWSRAVALAGGKGSPVFAGLFIQSLNNVIDLHAKRVTAGLRNRIPVSIWVTLYFVASLAMVVMGYHARLTGRRSTMATVALVMTFSAVMLLIMDLDRPDQHLFQVSQRAMADLLEKMHQPVP